MKNKPYLNKTHIDSRALDILDDLQSRGHTTYLVGGCVRDLLIGIQPKDFDIATTAKPREVKKAVPNCYIIGKRFRLVLAKRQDDLFEIATFRREVPDDERDEEFPNDDNTFGSPEEDARRRDFTINGLFYDPFADELIDHNNGLEDLKNGLIRMIGDPEERLLEDPVRILRAIRLAHKINFSLEPTLKQAIEDTADSLALAASPRIREEFLKFFRLQDPSKAFLEAHDLGVLKVVAPILDGLLADPESSRPLLYRLRNYELFQGDKNDPAILLSGLVHAVYRSQVQPNLDKFSRVKELEEHPILKPLMRDELRMFNLEQSLCLRSLQIQKTLAHWEEYERKGERRRNAVIQNEAFTLGLLFCEVDDSLTTKGWSFWLDSYENILPQLISEDRKKALNKKSPRRKGPRKPRPLRNKDSN